MNSNSKKILNSIALEVRQKLRGTPIVDFAAYPVDLNGEIIRNNLHEIAHHNRLKLVHQTWESPILDSPTWLDVMVLCNDVLLTTNERQYRNLRGIEIIQLEGEVAVAEFKLTT